MTWQVTEQDFATEEHGPGRTVVWLTNGIGLSIITPARNAYIREAKQYSPDAILHGWPVTDALADDDTYEVAAINEYGFDRKGVVPTPPGWGVHEDNHDGIVYQRMTAEMIDTYVNEVGVDPERSTP